MTNRFSIHLYACVSAMAAILVMASPADAQYQPRPLNDPATGERYHIEAAAGYWFPTADMSISSEALGQIGTVINFKDDLGLTDQKFPELHLELKASRRSKLRFQYIPISYTQGPTALSRPIIFNGQLYQIRLPVNSALDWKAYRFGYEFDFVVRNRGFAGLILDVKYTDVKAELTAPGGIAEFAHARAPIPAVGGVVRVYVVPNLSITGEVTGFRLPENISKGDTGHYADVDVYGTLNFTNNVGVQVGYRSLDVGYVVDTDTGSFKLKGMFVGLVARY